MTDAKLPPNFAGQLRGLQIVVFALAFGALLFPAIVVFVIQPEPADDAKMLSFASALMAGLALLMGLVLPSLTTEAGRKSIAKGEFRAAGSKGDVAAAEEAGDAGRLFNLFRGGTIVSAAIMEGAGLFATVAYMLEGRTWTLVPAFGLPLLILVLRMPTRDRVETWIERQLRLLRDER